MDNEFSVAIVGGTGSLGSALAIRLAAPGVKVVIGALHNISAVDLGDVNSPLGDVLVCGDNEEAKQKVMGIVRRIGARAFDAGPATNAYVIEGLTGVIIHLNRKHKSKHGSIKII